MNGLLSRLGLAVILGWVAFAVLGWVVSPPLSVWLGGAIGGLVVLMAHNTMILRGIVALLSTFGVMLPAIALRHMAAKMGVPVAPFATLEILAFLVFYVAFLTSAFGLVRLDLYRIGYAPLPVAAMVLAVCLYGALTGNWFLPLVAVLGQALWVSGWGSSNWFDHVTHVLLVPVALVVLILRLI